MYLKISYCADAVGPTPWKLYVPKNEPVTNGANNLFDAVISCAVILLPT